MWFGSTLSVVVEIPVIICCPTFSLVTGDISRTPLFGVRNIVNRVLPVLNRSLPVEVIKMETKVESWLVFFGLDE